MKEFQLGLSQELYEALAWEGLKYTVAWSDNYPTEEEQEAVSARINAFNALGSEDYFN